MNKVKDNILLLIIAAFITLASSGLGGLIVNYGWSQRIDEKILSICESIKDLRDSTKILFKITTDISLTNVEQKQQIENLKENLRNHTYQNRKDGGQK